jgi:hypothetical protein
MPPVGFEPTISALKRAKTVHALDRAVTVIGIMPYSLVKINVSEEHAAYTFTAEEQVKREASRLASGAVLPAATAVRTACSAESYEYSLQYVS